MEHFWIRLHKAISAVTRSQLREWAKGDFGMGTNRNVRGHSITLLSDGCTNFRKFLIEGTKPNLKKIKEYVDRSLMLVTALSPVIGYDKASKIAHYAMDNDLTLKDAALKLGFVTEDEFDRVVDPAKMVTPRVAAAV